MGLHKRTALTAKQKQAAYLYAIELKTMKEISGIINVTEQSLCAWKKLELFQEEIDRLLREEWKESCKELQKIMISKARKGEFKPLEYVLNSNGYRAPEEVVVSEKTISVNIDEDTEPEDIDQYIEEDIEEDNE